MQKAYFLKYKQYVDLYYNDLVGACRSCGTLPECTKISIKKSISEYTSYLRLDPIVRLMKLFYNFFIEDAEKVEN